MNFNLALGVYRHSLANPDRIAFSADGGQLTYAALARMARNIAGALQSAGVKPGDRVGILASRSVESCIGVLGALWAGCTYVPISVKVPEERLLGVLELSEPSALIADATGVELLSERAVTACRGLILVPDQHSAQALAAHTWEEVRAVSTLPDADQPSEPVAVRAEDLGYLMFTSGTTGVPKGVMISAGSVHHFLSVMQARYGLTPDDRVAESMELSFDLSVFNMFMAWNAGASLHSVPSAQLMAPVKFINDNGITVWLSVPSVIAVMKRLKAIRPGVLPSLRYSLFCGEPLPLSAAHAWRQAAPNSIVDNLYGPTEATVACLLERVTDRPAVTPERGIISIGVPVAGTEACIVSPDLKILRREQPGELALCGPQLASGYFRAPEGSASRFPVISGKRWYLTGDLAYQDYGGKFHHLGRTDNQVKVLGYRVELEEVEAHLRSLSETELVAAVAWPVSDGSAEGIVGFVAGRTIIAAEMREMFRRRVPSYMVPSSIRSIESMPLNANGKVDRKALIAQLEREKP